MPYVLKKIRKLLGPYIEKTINAVSENTPSGNLNYIITLVLLKALGDNPNYQRFNEIIGVLECCKLEVYRRKVAKYEDQKIKENGDVY